MREKKIIIYWKLYSSKMFKERGKIQNKKMLDTVKRAGRRSCRRRERELNLTDQQNGDSLETPNGI